MTNPSLTPSVPLSASKDKSCIERKRWILPCDNAEHLCRIHGGTRGIQKIKRLNDGWSIIWLHVRRGTDMWCGDLPHARWEHIGWAWIHTPDARWPLKILGESSKYRFWHVTCADLYLWSFPPPFFFLTKASWYLAGFEGGRKPSGDKQVQHECSGRNWCMTSGLLNQEKRARNQYLIRLTFDFFQTFPLCIILKWPPQISRKEINAVDIMNF